MGRQKFVIAAVGLTALFPTAANAQPSGISVCDVVMEQVRSRVQANDRRSMNTLKPIVRECVEFLKVEQARESRIAVDKAKELIDEYKKRDVAPKP